MVLDVKLEDGDGDAAASRSGNIPDTLSVFWVSVGVVWAVEGATRSRELPSTTCTGTNNPGVSHKGKEHLINPNTGIVFSLLFLLFGLLSVSLPYFLSSAISFAC